MTFMTIQRLRALVLIGLSTSTLWCPVAFAHHVLGRPSYGLNEDSNTPPSMQVETRIGDYFVNYMVFPAFPRPNEPGRVNLYAKRVDTGEPFQGDVIFRVRNDTWFGAEEQLLGVQRPDDNVYRQRFLFHEDGDFVITAEFQAASETHVIDFPLRIGDPWPLGFIGIAAAAVVVLLAAVSILQRKRLLREKLRSTRSEARSS